LTTSDQRSILRTAQQEGEKRHGIWPVQLVPFSLFDIQQRRVSMKRITFAICVVALVFAVAVLTQPAAQKAGVKNWTPEQQDALSAFSKYIAAALQGNIKEMRTYWHPNIVGWDLKQDSPINHDEFVKVEEGFYKDLKFIKLEFVPLAIQVEGKTSIIHLKYNDVVSDLAGKETSVSGNWTTVLIKQDKKWIILSNVWAEK
jgi:hypothetical protein